MGVYFEYPVDTLVHESPRWRIRGGFLNQDTGEVYLDVEATSSGGSFSYSYIYVQLVCVYPSGEYTMNRICGKDNPGFEDMYGDFSGSITVDLNDGAEYCYLAMRCAQYEDTDYGSGGSHCTISSDADHDPGYEIPGTRVTLDTTKAPVISNLRNTNPYNNKDGVSASTTTINIAWDSTGDDPPTKLQYKTGNGAWTDVPNNAYTLGLSGLSPGTTYTIQIKGSNEAGESNTLSITIRTRYAAPVITGQVTGQGLESLTFTWSSTRPLKTFKYKVGTNAEQTTSPNASSGTITVTGLSPGTKYNIVLNGTSTDTYDGISAAQVTIKGTTWGIATLYSIGTITHGQNFTVTISNVHLLDTTLKIWVTGNDKRMDFTKEMASNGNVTISLGEDNWDQVYRTFPRANTHTLYAQLITHGASKNYSDETQSKTITLTGIQKTAHIGVSNKPRRCQVYIGVNNKPRRCVSWVGVNNTPKRTI